MTYSAKLSRTRSVLARPPPLNPGLQALGLPVPPDGTTVRNSEFAKLKIVASDHATVPLVPLFSAYALERCDAPGGKTKTHVLKSGLLGDWLRGGGLRWGFRSTPQGDLTPPGANRKPTEKVGGSASQPPQGRHDPEKGAPCKF